MSAAITVPRDGDECLPSGGDDVVKALTRVRAAIAAACAGCGRSPETVRLLPVSKTVPAERIRQAVEAGLRTFGENKVQEARIKAEALSDLRIAWSVIGHLQSNKAKYVARFASEFQALDSLHVAEALDRRLGVEGRRLNVFVQVNTSAEASKFGLAPADVLAFASALRFCATCRSGCGRAGRKACRSTSSRWECRATFRSLSKRARPSSV
jgi:PLP dependent protein